MSTFRNFEEIEAWQNARELTNKIYEISKLGSFAKDFVLRDQIRSASISVMSNIAEGFERSGKGEFVHFLSIAKGSAGEVKNQLYIALDQNYIDEKVFDFLYNLTTNTAGKIGGLMNYLQYSEIKGTKFRKIKSK